MFVLHAEKTRLTVRQREPVTSGSVNVYNVRFEFSPDWEGLARTAVFRSGSQPVSVLLDDSGECVIPWEVTDPDDKKKTLYYGMSDVTVAPIPESYQDVSAVTAAAGDVLTGKIIVDAEGKVTTGTMVNNGGVDRTLTADAPSYSVPAGFHNGEGVVKIVPEAKTVTPTKAAQTVAPAEGKVLSGVTVEAIPDNFVDTTDADAAAGNLLAEKTAYVNGEKITGTMPNNGATGGAMDGLTTVSVTIPAGYTSDGTVSLTDDIEQALAAIRGVAA